MNCSDNLISLSDSGVGSTLSTSVTYSAAGSGGGGGEPKDNDDFSGGIFDTGVFDDGGRDGGENKGATGEDMGSGLLIDFSDEVQVPLSQGVLLQAEIDDTFGLYNLPQQASQGSVGGGEGNWNDGGLGEEGDENDAEKLVRSFTSGRKSVVVDKAKNKVKDGHGKDGDNEKKADEKENSSEEGRNDSDDSIGSDQPTIVDSDGIPSPDLPTDEDDEKGIMDEKMDLTSNSNISAGSDSEILDVDNLSGFSIPEEEVDENKFIEDIRRKDMAASSTTTAIVNKIKLELLQDEDEEEDVSSILRSRLRREEQQHGLLSEISRPSLVTSTVSSFTSRLSSASTASASSQKTGSSFGDSHLVSSICDGTGVSTGRARLSSTSFGSPIRSSYPLSNKYFMPTPKAKTPSAAATFSREDYHRDRLTDSIYSPNRTRVMLFTGDSHRSPCRVPVRKSISAETLHFEHRSPAREQQRHIVKFSTPSASNKSRHSFSIHSNLPDYPNFFGDDRPASAQRQRANTYSYDVEEAVEAERPGNFNRHRGGRVSFASCSTTFSTSSHNLSLDSGSSIYPMDVDNSDTSIAGQFNKAVNLNDSSSSSGQPVRATAVIAPTNLSKPIIKPPATNANIRTGLVVPAKLKPGGQQGPAPCRPIAASSPNTLGSSVRPASNQTTPSRSRFGLNVRSSGYGPSQNLNSTFGANQQQPLKSPNKATTSTSANIKPAAIPKPLKTGSKLDFGSRGGGVTAPRTGITALKPGGKLPAPSSTGLRRPTTASAATSGIVGANKENTLRPATSTAGSRIGGLRPPHRQ